MAINHLNENTGQADADHGSTGSRHELATRQFFLRVHNALPVYILLYIPDLGYSKLIPLFYSVNEPPESKVDDPPSGSILRSCLMPIVLLV